MRKLNSVEVSQVSGGGVWDDFWQGFGAWIADNSYTDENMRIMEADPADIRAENPNDPLL